LVHTTEVQEVIAYWRTTNLEAYRAENGLGLAPTREEVEHARQLRQRAQDLFQMALAEANTVVPRPAIRAT
jgi:hypothetical protein